MELHDNIMPSKAVTFKYIYYFLKLKISLTFLVLWNVTKTNLWNPFEASFRVFNYFFVNLVL